MIFILFLCSVSLFFYSFGRGESLETEAKKVTLTEAVSLALSDNPALRQEEEELKKARLNLPRAYAVALPKISSNLSASRISSSQDSTNKSGAGQTSSSNDTTNYNFSVNLQQPIYAQGKTGILKRQAYMGIESAQFQAMFHEQGIIFDTLAAYYRVLKTKEIITIATEAQDQLREHLRVTRLKFEVGQIPETDILRVEAELATADKDLIEAQRNLDLALEGLNRYIRLDKPFEVVKPAMTVKPVNEVEEGSLYEMGLKNRLDFQKAQLARQIAEEGVQLAKAEFYPKVNFLVSYQRRDDSFFPSFEDETIFTGELELPIFEGGLRRIGIKEANAEYKKANWQLENRKLDLRLEITKASLEAQKISSSIRAVEKQIALAEENLRKVKLQYEEGLASNLDVIDANTLLVKARTDYSNLQYDQTLASLKIWFVVGRLTVRDLPQIYVTSQSLDVKGESPAQETSNHHHYQQLQ